MTCPSPAEKKCGLTHPPIRFALARRDDGRLSIALLVTASPPRRSSSTQPLLFAMVTFIAGAVARVDKQTTHADIDNYLVATNITGSGSAQTADIMVCPSKEDAELIAADVVLVPPRAGAAGTELAAASSRVLKTFGAHKITQLRKFGPGASGVTGSATLVLPPQASILSASQQTPRCRHLTLSASALALLLATWSCVPHPATQLTWSLLTPRLVLLLRQRSARPSFAWPSARRHRLRCLLARLAALLRHYSLLAASHTRVPKLCARLLLTRLISLPFSACLL